MGHERIGVLPKTRRWRSIVEQIAGASSSEPRVSSIIVETLRAVKGRFQGVETDSGVLAAFRFLVTLSFSTGLDNPRRFLRAEGIEIAAPASAASIARALDRYVTEHQAGSEYGELAKCSGIDAIAEWQEQHTSGTRSLFDSDKDALGAWRSASTGRGFCEVSRLFFARFTERHLRYFLEREASAVLPSVAQRDLFAEGIKAHVDRISQFSFETAAITQSFAAGWFNRHATGELPSRAKITAFLQVAFGKLREDLLRETTES